MDWIPIVSAMAIGFALGLVAAFALRIVQSKTADRLANELFRESEDQRKANLDAILDNVKASFGSLSLDALSKSTEEFLKLAKEKLETEREASVRELGEKKVLIDQQLQRMTSELDNVSTLVNELEKDRVLKFGELSEHLRSATEQTNALMQTTSSLREVLASSRARGQWGERMAEDVLRMAGFVEGVNYRKQETIDSSGTRPDFTFLLPRDLVLNMDVKFPLDNYIRFVEAASDTEKARCSRDFLKDVKTRVKEVTSRDYISPEQNTVDYALMFIPNEQIYVFIHEQDRSILDDALKNRVVICSPMTLFAVLAIVRQAVDNFMLEQTSNEILTLLSAFKKQWGEFLKKLDGLGKRIEAAQKDYHDLATTRRQQLEKPLYRIEAIRKQRRLPVAAVEEEDSGLAVEHTDIASDV